ncbi:MAG TPA: dienelactone hydrolase family protein [Chloroflexota bacterium]|jgi:carboxymethylenebutenolidase
MWNQWRTDAYNGMTAETVDIKGYNGETINAYYARSLVPGNHPGVVLINHAPGWDEFYRETTRRFAEHGYNAICPNIFYRAGHGTPEEVVAAQRAAGGVKDETVVGDIEGGAKFLKSQPNSNGKVGVFGTCSGGRHGFLVACKSKEFAALVECWGGGVIQPETTPAQPVSPNTLTKDLSCPMLGLFGNDDQRPSPDNVNQHEEELKAAGKNYEFHRYDGAGHGFFYYHAPAYRQQQCMDGWEKIFTFFGKNLA